MKVESIAECSLGAFCNTFDLHYVVLVIFFGVVSYDRFYCIQLSLMGIQFEKLKNFGRTIHTGKTGSGKGKQKYF